MLRGERVGLLWRGGLVVVLVVVVIVVLLTRGGGGESPEETLEKLQARTAEWAGAQAKISYVLTTTTTPQGIDASTWTLYWRPPDWRLDFAGRSAGQPVQGSVIVTGGRIYNCESRGGSGECHEAGPVKPELGRTGGTAVVLLPFPFLAFISSPNGFDQPTAGITSLGGEFDRKGRTIAGEKGDCFFVFGGQLRLSKTEWCFAEDGILLGMLTTVESPERKLEARLEALSISRDVADGDFQPPFPVQERVEPAPSPTPAP